MQITKLLRSEFIKNIVSLSCSSFLDEESDDTVITDTTESEYISSNDDENVENVKKEDNDDIFRLKAAKIRYFLMKSFNQYSFGSCFVKVANLERELVFGIVINK